MKAVLSLLKYYIAAFLLAIIAVLATEKLFAQEKPSFGQGQEVPLEQGQPKVVIEEQDLWQRDRWDGDRRYRDDRGYEDRNRYDYGYHDEYQNSYSCERYRYDRREYRRCLRRQNDYGWPGHGYGRQVTCELRFVDAYNRSLVTIRETKHGRNADWEARNIVYNECLRESHQRRISPFLNCVVNRIRCN